MERETSLLKLGARVRFQNRWQGRISGFDISEDWEILNVVVSCGVLLFAQSVKLPFSSVTGWSEEGVDIDANSFAAFAREVPPVAVPSRPISSESPVSHQGARLSGLLVRRGDRRATEVLIARGRRRYRISSADVRIEGSTITLGKHFGSLPRYYSDVDLESRLHDVVAEDDLLTADDKRSLMLRVEGGVAIVCGNVRVKPTREHVRSIVHALPGILAVQEDAVDDISLETSIGLALNHSGLQRRAQVFARSNLGRVTLYGSASSDRLADDVIREVARIPGVRQVDSRLSLSPA
ncbi:MAG: BON domain-containing protein [Dehalococcoidia bacterium]